MVHASEAQMAHDWDEYWDHNFDSYFPPEEEDRIERD